MDLFQQSVRQSTKIHIDSLTCKIWTNYSLFWTYLSCQVQLKSIHIADYFPILLAIEMSKPGPAYNRLLNVLHSKTVPEIGHKMSAVKRVLYDEESASRTGPSILDDMMRGRKDQKQMHAAMALAESRIPGIAKSNILRLNCPIAQVATADLHNIYPSSQDRQFALPPDIRNGPMFHLVKSRNPFSLLFLGSYYLIFPNYNQACVYYIESKGKLINGFEMNLEFVHPTENHLRHMGSPLLDLRNRVSTADLEQLSDNYKQMPCKDIFYGSDRQLKIITELGNIEKDRSSYRNLDADPLFGIMEYFLDIPSRYSLVVVRNLPFGITKPTLNQLLWNYDFRTEDNPQNSIRILHSDTTTQTTLVLIAFKDALNARRFVRNYHGRQWDKMSKIKLKSLYEPIRCEIVD